LLSGERFNLIARFPKRNAAQTHVGAPRACGKFCAQAPFNVRKCLSFKGFSSIEPECSKLPNPFRMNNLASVSGKNYALGAGLAFLPGIRYDFHSRLAAISAATWCQTPDIS
jgi:hypothetical protein